MRVKLLVNGNVYDSEETPIVIEFTDYEQVVFGVVSDRIVSAPPQVTEKEREALLMREL